MGRMASFSVLLGFFLAIGPFAVDAVEVVSDSAATYYIYDLPAL